MMEMKSDRQADTNRSDSELLENYNYAVVAAQALYGENGSFNYIDVVIQQNWLKFVCKPSPYTSSTLFVGLVQ